MVQGGSGRVMTRLLRPPERPEQPGPSKKDQLDPFIEGQRYGLSREQSLALWEHVQRHGADGRTDSDELRSAFREVASRLGEGGRPRPAIGKTTRVKLEAASRLGNRDRSQPAIGKTTHVRLELDDEALEINGSRGRSMRDAPGAVVGRALRRTFGVGDEIAIQTGAALPRNAQGGRGYALDAKVFVRASTIDLADLADRLLLGHELAHVVQQRRGTGLPAAVLDAALRSELEAEAEAAAQAFVYGRPFTITGRAPAGVALYDDKRKQVVRMTLLGDLMILELEGGTKESVKCGYNGKLAPGQYTFDTATGMIRNAGAAANAAGNVLEFYEPPDAKMDGLPSIPLEVRGARLGGIHAAHRVQAEPQLEVAMPGTKVKYYVAMDPEMGGSYEYKWYCINDPETVKNNLLIPPIVNGPSTASWDATWAAPGRHIVVCEVTLKGGSRSRTEILEFYQRVRTEREITEGAFAATEAPDYGRFRAGLELKNLELLDGGLQDQSKKNGPYIQNSGANPAVPGIAPDLASNTYTIVPSPAAKRFLWYVRCASWELMPTQSFYGYNRIKVDGEDAFDLASSGRSAKFIIASRNKYTILCEELDDQGHKLGTRASYVQVVESKDNAAQRAKWQKYMAQADGAMAKIADGKEVGLRAVYVNRETGQQVPLQLYAGQAAGDSSKVLLVDLLPGVDRLEYSGSTIGEALASFERGNAYPKGTIKLEVPANKVGLPTVSKQIETNGESLWAAWSSRIGWASLGLTVAGVVAAAIPGGQPVAMLLFISAAGTGAIASGLSLYDRLQKAEKSPVGIALDIAGIAASVVGGATAFRALRGGAALTFTGATGRFLFYSGFATNAVSGLLISVEGVDEIAKILESPMPRGEKISAIVRILGNLVLQGALVALSVRDIARLRGRIGSVIGEEVAKGLPADALHSLNLLDDKALAGLKGLSTDQLKRFARLEPPVGQALAKAKPASIKVLLEDPETVIRHLPFEHTETLDQLAVMGKDARAKLVGKIGGRPQPIAKVLWQLDLETLQRLSGVLEHEFDVLGSLRPEALKKLAPLHALQLKNVASLAPAELAELAKLDPKRIAQLSRLEPGELIKARPFTEAAVDAKLTDLRSTEGHVGAELSDPHTRHHLRETNFADRGALDNPGHAVRVIVGGKPVAVQAPQYVRLEPIPATGGAPPTTIKRVEVTAPRADKPSVIVTGDMAPNPMTTAIEAPVPGTPYPKVMVETSTGTVPYVDVERPPPGTRVQIKPKELASSGFAGGHTRAAWDAAEKTYGDVVTKTGEQSIKFKLPGKPDVIEATAIRAEVTTKPGTTKQFKDPKTIFEKGTDLDAFEAHAKPYIAAKVEALRSAPPPNNVIVPVDVPVSTTAGVDAIVKIELPWNSSLAGTSASPVDIRTWWLAQSNFVKGSAFNP